MTMQIVPSGTKVIFRLPGTQGPPGNVPDGSLTEAKYATGSVSSRAIADGTIARADIDQDYIAGVEANAVEVTNRTGSTINAGVLVAFDGIQDDVPKVRLFDASADSAYLALGITMESIANNGTGNVATMGIVDGLNTNAYPLDAPLWADQASPGGLTATQPSSGVKLPVAVVVRSGPGTSGSLLVRVQPDDTVDLVPTTRTITAGTGLTGGGDLSANRTVSVDFGEVATATQGDTADSAAQAVDHYLTPNQASGGDTLGNATGFAMQTGNATLSYTTSEQFAGAGSIAMTLGAGVTGAFATLGSTLGLPVLTDRPVTFAVAMKAPAGVAGSLRLQWRDDAGATVGTALVLQFVSGDGEWHIYQGTRTRPVGATRANYFFGISNASGGEIVYIDRVSVHDELAAVATSGDYDDLTDKPTLGTAAATDAIDYATAAQGVKADSLISPMSDASISGRWLTSQGIRSVSAGAAGSVRMFRVWLPAGTLDRIACDVTTAAAGATARLGIYLDDDAFVGDLLLDAGTVDASTTGVKEITISETITEGYYWLAFRSQSTGSQASFRTMGNFSGQGVRYLTAAEASAGRPFAGYRTGISGAVVAADPLPSSFSAPSVVAADGALMYFVAVRYA